jgi:AcrR family transcriptional regulator
MPKRVDHEERRRHIADALLRVISRDGLEAVSLRHVATEAGVTAGMVQHYFPSKDAMMEFAMRAASARFEQRITANLEGLGASPDPGRILRATLSGLLPADAEADDARVALAFQTYAASRAAAAGKLEEGNARLREHVAGLIDAAGAGVDNPRVAATALLATAEGLGVQMLSARLPKKTAQRALDHHIDLILGTF